MLQDRGFNAGNLGLLQDSDIGDEVVLVYVNDGAQEALVEALEGADVATVGDQSLQGLEWLVVERGSVLEDF